MIVQPRWRKVIKDLWGHKVRTALVVLSIAIGVFAVGMIMATDVMLRQDLTRGYLATEPASAILFVSPFEQDLVDVAAAVPDVWAAEGRRKVGVRTQVGPDQWKTLEIEAAAGYDGLTVSKVFAEGGDWPPPDNTLAVERASLPLLGVALGETLTVERADGRFREIPVAALAHDVSGAPPQFTGEPVAFATLPTLEWLGFDQTFSELHILTAPGLGKAEIEAVAERVADRVERAGYVVYRTRVPEPGEHPLQDILDPLLLILGVLGALSLFASSFLVINIINGLLSQQTQQIGIMKAVGARRRQIIGMYLVAIIVLGALALLLAIPAGSLAAYFFTRYIAGLLNFDLAGFRIPPGPVAVMIAIGLLIPLLAALVPVLNGSRVSVREALSSSGLTRSGFGLSLIDRMLALLTSALRLSRPMQISLRNTVRRKARLILTLITLTLGGAIFIGIVSVHASLLKTLDEALAYFAYDVEINFQRDYRIAELDALAREVPGVVATDSWIGASAVVQRAGGDDGAAFPLLGTLADTAFISPRLLQGRWLRLDDANALVVNSDVLDEEPELGVGDRVRLEVDGREAEWEVVGIVQAVMTGPLAYANRPYLERELRQIDRSASLQVRGAANDAASQQTLARDLKNHFESRGFQVETTGTISEIRERVEYQFNLLIVFLAIMAVLIATVGGLGLMGTMSINVLERTREIGVMRAVGASDSSVLRIVLVEGVFVGLISWALATLFGYPIGRALSVTVGNSLLDNPLSFQFAWHGAVGWLAVVLAIAAAASAFPALRAARLSVQQTLAYE